LCSSPASESSESSLVAFTFARLVFEGGTTGDVSLSEIVLLRLD
jgi:hypothetical protein